ncbi:unnamed protein product, partial [Arabidopsis halleri]
THGTYIWTVICRHMCNDLEWFMNVKRRGSLLKPISMCLGASCTRVRLKMP